MNQLTLTDYSNTFLISSTAESLIEVFLETRVLPFAIKSPSN